MLMKYHGMDLHIRDLAGIPKFLKTHDPVEYRRLKNEFSNVGYDLEVLRWREVLKILRTEPYMEVTIREVMNRVFAILQLQYDCSIENPYAHSCVNRIGFYHRLESRKRASEEEPSMYEDPIIYSEQEGENVLEGVLLELSEVRNEYKSIVFETVFV